jgi:aspartyl-tRNA(Asn)/glutamyl-tRNA(Gln) amidotransferase subunit B
MPELPDARRNRFTEEYGIPDFDSSVLTSSRKLADYYETVVKLGSNPKKSSNWIMSELLARVDDVDNIDSFIIKPEMLASLLKLIDNNTISGKIAKTVFDEMISSGKNPEVIVKEKGLEQVTDTGAIEAVINKVLENNMKSVEDYKSGKDNALKFLIGQVMKESKGKANPQIVNDILLSKIK